MLLLLMMASFASHLFWNQNSWTQGFSRLVWGLLRLQSAYNHSWISIFFSAEIWVLVRSFVAKPRSTKFFCNWFLTSLTYFSFNFLRIVSAYLMTYLLFITKQTSWLVKLPNSCDRNGSIGRSVWMICKNDLNMLVMKAKNCSFHGTNTFVWYFTRASYDLLDKRSDLLNPSQYFMFSILFQICRALSTTAKSYPHRVKQNLRKQYSKLVEDNIGTSKRKKLFVFLSYNHPFLLGSHAVSKTLI